jgi:predicted cobalt transporter CbtA
VAVPILRRAKTSADRSEHSRSEAVSLLGAYVKQETVEPLKGLWRFVLFGVTGSVAIAIGTVLLLVAVLRILQSETGAFHGNLSWLPYVIVTALGLAIVALSGWRIFAGAAARRTTPKKTTE